MNRLIPGILLAGITLALAGCGGEEHSDLKQELNSLSKDLRGKIDPLPVVRPYEPVPYASFDMPEPFGSTKIELVTKASVGGGGLKPDLTRPKEPLEAFPLESLAMVGVLQQGKQVFALVRADTNLYRVKVGNYLGQNFGRIVAVSDSSIKLKEIVQDSNGNWEEKEQTLLLQE